VSRMTLPECSGASRVRALRAPAAPPLTRPARSGEANLRVTGRRMPPAGAQGSGCTSLALVSTMIHHGRRHTSRNHSEISARQLVMSILWPQFLRILMAVYTSLPRAHPLGWTPGGEGVGRSGHRDLSRGHRDASPGEEGAPATWRVLSGRVGLSPGSRREPRRRSSRSSPLSLHDGGRCGVLLGSRPSGAASEERCTRGGHP
jgi:hypothetical protein